MRQSISRFVSSTSSSEATGDQICQTKIYFKSIEDAINAVQPQEVYVLMVNFRIERSYLMMALLVSVAFVPTLVFAFITAVALVPTLVLAVVTVVGIIVAPASARETSWVRAS